MSRAIRRVATLLLPGGGMIPGDLNFRTVRRLIDIGSAGDRRSRLLQHGEVGFRISRQFIRFREQHHLGVSTPAASRCRAMTSPSPPLFPLPQQMTTRPSTPSLRSQSVHPRPAFSISTRTDRPNTSIARWSTEVYQAPSLIPSPILT
jgi:hypothetical protein